MTEAAEGELAGLDDPFALFAEWFAQAERTEPNDANAVTLATATPDGVPSARMVLLKGVDAEGAGDRGLVFYTNLESRKGVELLANPHAALCFYWKSLRRQVGLRTSELDPAHRPAGLADLEERIWVHLENGELNASQHQLILEFIRESGQWAAAPKPETGANTG